MGAIKHHLQPATPERPKGGTYTERERQNRFDIFISLCFYSDAVETVQSDYISSKVLQEIRVPFRSTS